MKWTVAALFLSVCLVLSNNALAQSGNASVGGFVQDSTQAFIPGVTVTATNTQTGVTTTAITNESRVWLFIATALVDSRQALQSRISTL